MESKEASTSARFEWERVFGTAIEAASRAMSIWTHGRITVSLDEIGELPLADLGSAVQGGQDIATVVALDVRGEVGGQFLLTVDDEGAAKLAGLLLNRPPRPIAEWSELERSALMETGNILGSAYLSALTEITGLSLFPSPPQIVRDYLVGILEQAVMSQAIESDCVLLARTCFRNRNEDADWNMIFVPSPQLMNVLLNTAAAPIS
jgi:chemotaxis protein CheC